MEEFGKLTEEIRLVEEPGVSIVPLIRLTDPAYEDDIDDPVEGPNAAQIAATVFDQDEDIPSSLSLSLLWVIWGQFLDHDITLTPEGGDEFIFVDGLIAPVSRSIYDDATGTDPSNPREQFNVITSFIDASNVYGSDTVRLAELRTFEGGLMKTTDGIDGVDFLPLNTAGLPNAGEAGEPLFLAGDVRANENTALTALHTVFVNEHNYWADRLREEHPDWTDEELFQAARAAVEMLVQRITYEEFLPHLIGEGVLGALPESPDGIDPSIATEFSTAAYRFGHSMITSFQPRIEEDGSASAEGDLSLIDAFFDNSAINDFGVTTLLRGIAELSAQELDAQLVDELNFFLFSDDGGLSGFSLAALNIVRGRDHGIASYVDVRAALMPDSIDLDTLDPYDFSIITADVEVQAKLAEVYGTVDQVDLWVGGIAEDHVAGITVGPLFQLIMIDQFARLRDADPLWYERRTWLDEDIYEELLATQLSDILMRSGGIDHMQRDAFLSSDRQGGTEGSDDLIGDDGRDLLIGFGGHDDIHGGGGDDDLFGDGGRDMLYGDAGSDGLYGGGGADMLFGGAGDDELWGAEGRDVLTGGAGRDLFLLKNFDNSFDEITDFTALDDLIIFKGYKSEFEDLSITVHRGTASLSIGSTLIARVEGDIEFLDADHLLFIG